MSQIVGAAVLPVALISASGLLCLALYNRLLAVVTRLRSFQRERFQEQEFLLKHAHDNTDPLILTRHQEFLSSLHVQCKHVIRRAHALKRCLMSLLSTVILLICASLGLGLSVRWPQVVYAAVPIFVLGMLMMMVAMFFAMYELNLSLQPIELEQEVLDRLGKSLEETEHSV